MDENKIFGLLSDAQNAKKDKIDPILEKAASLKRLTLEETAALLAVNDADSLNKIYKTAAYVKDTIYGRRVVLFAPLYISSVCSNACLYCAFRSDNILLKRKTLSIPEIKEQVRWLLKRGHKRILMVAGESPLSGNKNIDYYTSAIKAVYSTAVGKNKIKRVNINCAPLNAEEFRKLKKAGIGTYQLFQETYHEGTYRYAHPSGPKNDPDNRIEAIDRAFLAGIDDVGIGVLYGLYDYRFDTLAMLMHVEHLEKKFNIGPHTISVPRIEPALGSGFSLSTPYKVSDDEYRKIVAVLRLSVPYTGIILSTRETAAMRDELFGLGVSQISAESKTSPGGYSIPDINNDSGAQFSLNDNRSLEEIINSLVEKGFIPSFCAACYRKERTGETFMNLAKPGTIKGKCSLNALITLKEYLDDFAGENTKKAGYKLIRKTAYALDRRSQEQLSEFIAEIDKGVRDRYI